MNNRYYLFIELLVLFIGVPLVFYFELVSIPKIAGLLVVALFTVLVLWFDKRHDFSELFALPDDNASVQNLLLKSLAVALTIAGLVLLINPDELFIFPSQQPLIWMVVMLLYPLLSALPQELIYRAFFFQRYEELFPSEQWLGITSAITFSALHIIYDNWWAVGLSLIGGFIFVETYRKSKSLYWVSVEHAIYGFLVFTIGMGHYFYEAL